MKTKLTGPLALVTLLASVLVLVSGMAFAAANARFVAPRGNDGANTCTNAKNPCQTIQHAIFAASAGDTILLTEGTYVEVGQIVIAKNLSIAGWNRASAIIKPAQDTGAAYYDDDSAWILVRSGVTFNLSGVTLDGTNRLVTNAIVSHGHGRIDGNIFTNIAYNQSGPDYNGAAIALYGSDMTVHNNRFGGIGREGVFAAFSSAVTITDNVYTGKGPGNWLDYGIEVGHNSTATISGNIISGNTGVASVDGSTSAAVVVSTYFDVAPATSAIIVTGNAITGSTDGIVAGFLPDDASTVVAYSNNVGDNAGYGVVSTNPAGTNVDAMCNWWGSISGPSGAGPGTGSAVSTGVAFAHWLKDSNLLRHMKCP